MHQRKTIVLAFLVDLTCKPKHDTMTRLIPWNIHTIRRSLSKQTQFQTEAHRSRIDKEVLLIIDQHQSHACFRREHVIFWFQCQSGLRKS